MSTGTLVLPWLTAQQVMQLLQLTCRNTLDRWVNAGKFPPPVHLGLGRGILRWNRDTVEKFLREREKVGAAERVTSPDRDCTDFCTVDQSGSRGIDKSIQSNYFRGYVVPAAYLENHHERDYGRGGEADRELLDTAGNAWAPLGEPGDLDALGGVA
jgi:predicted DNA-binding transcriptional regulator AlpA